jgi:MFS transporter, DHA3 family, macrolide efflux protein
LDQKNTQPLKPFFILWIGQAFSILGSQLVQFAIIWWLTRTTGSATHLALATLVSLLPQIFLGPFAGALVDRWNRRRVMIIADSIIALATLLMVFLFWMDMTAIWLIYALLLVRSAGGAFHMPAMQASTTMLVPEKHLARVAGLNQALYGVSSILIPPLGALAIEALPLQGVLAIDVATAIPAITVLLFIRIPQPNRSLTISTTGSPSTIWMEMRAGFQFIYPWKGLFIFALISILINMLGQAAGSFVPLLVRKDFNGGALQLGWLQTASGIAMLVGGAALGLWGGIKRRMLPAMLALLMDGLVMAAVGLTPANAFWLVVVFFFLSALFETFVFGLTGAVGQAIIPPEIQGRIFSLMTTLSNTLTPLGLLVAGPVADQLGVRFWWMLTGSIIAAMGIAALVIPSVANIETSQEALRYKLSPASLETSE